MFLSMETINSWCHPLAPDYTCQSKAFVPRGRRAWTAPSNASLQDLCPCSLSSSQPQPGRGFSLGFPNSPPSFPVRPSLASNLQGTNTQLFPRLGGEDPFTFLLHVCPVRGLRLGCRVCLSSSPSPSEVRRFVLLTAAHLSVLHSDQSCSFLVCC